jgi:hypothetical protein
MTWAQGTFAYCFGIIVPTVGILSALRVRREGKPALKGFILSSAATFVAFIACCYIAKLSFPHYPTKQIPEPLANAFTLPGVIGGILAIWFASDSRKTSKTFCIKASLATIAIYGAGIIFCYQMFTWSFRKELPWSATDIQEAYHSDTLLPDYDYRLKAKVSEAQFQKYIKKFNLSLHTKDRKYSDDVIWLHWSAPSKSKSGWWNPTDSLTNTFVWQGSDTWIFAKYENGYLYLGSLNH